MSPGPIATRSCRIISPVSSPSSINIVVTPVSLSPAKRGAWIGDAPRYLGKSDGMQVDAAERGQFEQRLWDQLPKSDQDDRLGGKARITSMNCGIPHLFRLVDI